MPRLSNDIFSYIIYKPDDFKFSCSSNVIMVTNLVHLLREISKSFIVKSETQKRVDMELLIIDWIFLFYAKELGMSMYFSLRVRDILPKLRIAKTLSLFKCHN